MKKRIIVLMQGGLGNQLFIFYAMFALAKQYDAELILDIETGFNRDLKYNRSFELRALTKTIKKTSKWYSFNSFIYTALKQIDKIPYIKNKFTLTEYSITVKRKKIMDNLWPVSYIDGYWQDESLLYSSSNTIMNMWFNTYGNLIDDPQTITDHKNCVSLHIRKYSAQDIKSNIDIGKAYYSKAFDLIEDLLTSPPLYIVFSDSSTIDEIESLLKGKKYITAYNLVGNMNAIQNLVFMSKFKYHIIANSSYSWWGAWLSREHNKIVVAPKVGVKSYGRHWDNQKLLPNEWIQAL